MKKTDEIKLFVKEVLYNSFAQAILRLFLTPHRIALRIFLFLFILSSLALSSFMVIESVGDFLSFPDFETSRTVFEASTYFPMVTICNINPITTQYGYEFVRDVNRIYAPNESIFDDSTLNLSGTKRFNLKKLIRNQTFIHMHTQMLNEMKRRMLSHSKHNVLFHCSFRNEICTSSDFQWTFDPIYGNCFIFNNGYF